MITINLSPIRDDRSLTIEARGGMLMFNGQAIDLAAYDPEISPCDWIIGAVTRDGNDFAVTVLAPYCADAPHEAHWPEPIIVAEDGPVKLPGKAQIEASDSAHLD